MNSTLKRFMGASGAAAIVASAALVAAPAAQADGQYYGTWTLTAWKLGSQTVPCPGKLPLPPPAPTIECKGGEILKLKSNYRYKTNIPAFSRSSSTGDFEILKFPNRPHHTILFDSDRAGDDARAYDVRLQGFGEGAPKKMVISLNVSIGGGEAVPLKMIFRRDAD